MMVPWAPECEICSAARCQSLRYEPTDKRLRIYLNEAQVADTVNGLLVWEPRRVVPTYAVPERGCLGPAGIGGQG